MSTDKSDYVRFELRFETEFSGRFDAWINANRPGIAKSVIIRELVDILIEGGVGINPDLMSKIDEFRKRSTPPHTRQTIVETAVSDYIERS